MNKTTLINAMGSAPSIRSKVLVEDQTVEDIMDGMLDKHAECKDYYDDIVGYFWGDNLYDSCRKIWNFCKKSFTYNIEDIELQRISSPTTMLKRGDVDCKGYSLFIAGVLDAMRREGESMDLCFRFVSQNLLDPGKHHVFVVVNPGTDNIWIDPVMGSFDAHPWYWYKTDRCMSRGVGGLSGVTSSGMLAVNHAGTGRKSIAGYTLTPAQSGAAYGQKAYNNQNLIPGAGAAFLANPPVTYFVNGGQLVLPPENTVAGSAVPALPVGLQVQYAPSFMGYPIPSNMPVPIVVPGNKLQFSCPVNAPGCITTTELLANNKVLLNILMSAFGALINSYSSYPYANGFNMLSNDILTKSSPTSKADMLMPDDNKTFAGTILTDVGNTVLPIVAPVVGVVVSAVATPAAGAAAAAALEGVDSVLNSAENVSNYGATTVLPATDAASAVTTLPAASTTFSLSNLTSISASNPLLWLLGAAGVFLILNTDE